MHVIVIGGGIGGLALAQGLRKAGVSVAVYERDSGPASRWEGYRIHIDPAGARSLRACLPENLWQAFLATCGPGGDFGFVTEGLRELVVVEESIAYPAVSDPAEGHYAADRPTLRRLLRAGLGDVVRFGAEFTRYEHTADGRVAAVFADGSRAVGDVLVGADGASSRVRRQRLPQARSVSAGAVGMAHKIWLTEEITGLVPERLLTGMNIVMVDQRCFMFTSVFTPPPGAAEALAEADGGPEPASLKRPYLLCALVAHPDVLPQGVTELTGDALARVVDTLIADWSPDLRRLLARADPESLGAISFNASEPVPAWASGNVTVLGDAVHTMPPIGGLGGNTALRDARLLTRMLTAAHRGERELVPAIAAYEEQMREYGYAAVRSALAEKDQVLANTGAFGQIMLRTWFRICAKVGPLRRRTFRQGFAHSAPRAWETETPGSRENEPVTTGV
ncbi:FAD-dependent oxidoreductase [Rhizohabitans arisaemae]|uniref:FAD-dependent oxidoreductase n=1 Tax=Rhizohabitans arisaemae TaxID=2720610 RepID=UPI0024B074F0|nr:NAD(P)/FAD-dependent oxidoreductase [Rhizohabitans arisaemae]